MLATFAFDVCHDVYLAAREAIDAKMPTLNAENSGKYQWRPDRMPRLAEYVCDFARAGERVLGGSSTNFFPGIVSRRSLWRSFAHAADRAGNARRRAAAGRIKYGGASAENPRMEMCPAVRPSRLAMFRVYYLGGAEYQAARRHLGISELTWADWADEIRRQVGRELTRCGVFPPSKYFQEMTKADQASA